jgi:two-component system chemotaxis response regulator CheY
MAVNILIVDDSGVMRSMIAITIRLSGLALGEIHQAGNGQEGLDVLNQSWIDLVIADINMPVMNGEEMIDRMLEDGFCDVYFFSDQQLGEDILRKASAQI